VPPQGKASNLVRNPSIKNWRPHGGLLKGNLLFGSGNGPLGVGVGPIRRNGGLIEGGHPSGGSVPHGSGSGPYGRGHMGRNTTY
jgi:hypothetical protein